MSKVLSSTMCRFFRSDIIRGRPMNQRGRPMPREGTKHKNGQVLMSSVVHDVVLYVHCKDSMCFWGLWDVHDV
jgi:hypothetical protein